MKKSKERKLVIEPNHVSEQISEKDLKTLNEFFLVVHKNQWMMKQSRKSLTKKNILLNIASAILGLSGIGATVGTGPIALIPTGLAIVLKIYTDAQGLAKKAERAKIAEVDFRKLMDLISEIKRGGEVFDEHDFARDLASLERRVHEQFIDTRKFEKKYNSKFDPKV